MSPAVALALALAASVTPSPIELTVDRLDGAALVEARLDGQAVWQRVHFDAPTAGPVTIDGYVVYALGRRVFVVDAARGVTLGRVFLDSVATASESDLAAGVFEVHPSWQADPSTVAVADLIARAGVPAPGTFDMTLLGARRDALALEALSDPSVIEQQARLQPDNPWIELARAAWLSADGDSGPQAAGRAVADDGSPCGVLLTGGPTGPERVRLASDLMTRCPADARAAFDVGLQAARDAGFRHELVRWMVTPVLALGGADASLALDDLVQRADWTWQLAPRAEGTARLYQGVADALRASEDPAAAGLWEDRAQAAAPFVFMGLELPAVRHAGTMLHLLAACLATLLLMALVATLRFLPPIAPRGRRRLRDLVFTTWWPRPLMVGLLLVLGAGGWAGARLAEGVALLGAAAMLPTSVAAGDLGHPESQALWSRAAGTEPGRYMYGLSLQLAGEREAAAAVYRTAPAHQGAVDNLALLAAEAAGEDPGPLAQPEEETWAAALRATLDPPGAAATLESAEYVVGALGGGAPAGLGLTLAALLGLLGLVGLAAHAGGVRPAWASPSPLRALARGFDGPGAALLPLAAAAALTAASMVALYVSTDGVATDVLTALAVPDVERWFGASAPLHADLGPPIVLGALALLATLVLRLGGGRVGAPWATAHRTSPRGSSPSRSTPSSPSPSWR